MKISAALSSVTTLGIESAPFIYYVEKNPTYVQRMHAIFQWVTVSKIAAVTSVITLTEVLSHPMRRGDQIVETAYRNLLTQSRELKLVPIISIVAEKAAELRARYNLRTPDALQVASALQAGCDALLTNDLGLQRVKELPILVLDELELDI